VRELRKRHTQSVIGSPRAGEPTMRVPAAADRAQPDLTSALAGSTALSRATSGNSVADGDAGSVTRNQSPRQSPLAPGTAAFADPRRAYTVNDTARILSVSRSTIYKLIKLHSLKALKLCGRRIVTRESIENLLAGNE
jgi:excisionase family DNA binding protein